ncbi:MAG: YicC family protein [Parachlamydiales bacterium]|nr:YicC family protein [Parachlamydiales bacterium]
MLKSMTGFARASISSKLGRLNVEISAVNRRFLEVSLSIPKTFFFLENEIRKLIEKNISRGNVFIKFEFFPNEKNIFSLLPNASYMKNLKKAWEKLSKDLGYKKCEIDLEFIVQQAKYIPEEKIIDEESYKTLFLNLTKKALFNLNKMKIKEGEHLHIDIEKRIMKIKSVLTLIKKRAPLAKKVYEEKLKDKLKNFIKESKFEERMLTEVAIFAEKGDITEEITRLDSHLKQFLEFIKLSKEAIGRKLDFLLQEALRESNTIASKSQDIQISSKVVEIKSEIEKIKEQIQNIE